MQAVCQSMRTSLWSEPRRVCAGLPVSARVEGGSGPRVVEICATGGIWADRIAVGCDVMEMGKGEVDDAPNAGNVGVRVEDE